MAGIILLSAQNLNKQFSIVLFNYSGSNSGGPWKETVNLNLTNRSNCRMLVLSFKAYNSSNNAALQTSFQSSFQLDTNSQRMLTVQYEGGQFLQMGGWIVEIMYVNMEDGKVYTKKASKRANFFGSNIELTDISDSDTDGIDEIETHNNGNYKFYDLGGKPVTTPKKTKLLF